MSENVFLTITLTGRPPIKITKEFWPIVARGQDVYYPRTGVADTYDLKVRKHADGRCIAYAVFDHSTEWPGEKDLQVRCGELLEPDAEVIPALQRIVGDMVARLDAEAMRSGVFLRLMEECIADFPAVEI